MKNGLALCGGGALGIYELGAWKALNELKLKFDIITGTSIGALNGALIVQDEYEKAYELWKSLKIESIMNNAFDIEEVNIRKIIRHSDFKTFLASYVKGFGGDIKPFKEMISSNLNCEKIRNSKKILGVIVTQFPSIKKEEVILNKLNDEEMYKYILASASCFPVFPLCKINNKQYIDGGYTDNLPIDFAIKLGAKHVIAIDLKTYNTHKEYVNNPMIDYIYPKWDLGSFLYFDSLHLERNRFLGYYDVLKFYGKYDGFRYTFNKSKKYNSTSTKLVKKIMDDVIYFNNKKKKSYIKKDIKNILDYLNLHINKLPTNYEYYLKCVEELGVIFEMSACIVYDLNDFIAEVKNRIETNIDYKIGEEYVLLESDAKKREFISNVDKKKFIGFMYKVKHNQDFRILLLQTSFELYLSLMILEN